jgi:hypothetical protein
MIEDQKADMIFQSMVSNPLVDQTALTKMYLMKRFDLDPDEVNDLMVMKEGVDTSLPGVPAGLEDGGMGQSMMPEGMQPQGAQPQIEIKARDLVKLYDLASGQPDLQAQIVSMLGLEPSEYPDLPWTQMVVKGDQELLNKLVDLQKTNQGVNPNSLPNNPEDLQNITEGDNEQQVPSV